MSDRFIIVHKEGNSFNGKRMVLVDRETGVNYLAWSYGYGGGLTPLLDADGKPVVTKI